MTQLLRQKTSAKFYRPHSLATFALQVTGSIVYTQDKECRRKYYPYLFDLINILKDHNCVIVTMELTWSYHGVASELCRSYSARKIEINGRWQGRRPFQDKDTEYLQQTQDKSLWVFIYGVAA